MQMLNKRQQPMDDLRLFCRYAEEARGVGYGMRGGECFEPRFEVGELFGVFGCLLVLGVDAVAEVVEADGYYWDHAARWVRISFLKRGKEVKRLTRMDRGFLAVPFPRGRH